MTTPQGGGSDRAEPEPSGWAAPPPASEPDQPVAQEPTFDPYRYGAPDHPVPPEYAPPGYTPPPTPPPAPPAGQQPGYGQPGWGRPGYGQPGYGPDSGPPPGYPVYPPAGGGYGGYPQQPGGPVGYGAPPFHGYPQPATGSGRAVAALVLGILSIALCWTTFFDLLLIIPAVIFAIIELNDSSRRGQPRGMARAGLICAVIGTVLAIAVTVFFVHRINHCGQLYDSGTSSYDTCLRTGH